VAVSCMHNDEDVLADCEKTIFDWCKEGAVTRVRKLLNKNQDAVNEKDDEVCLMMNIIPYISTLLK